jgi:hypothetical protein
MTSPTPPGREIGPAQRTALGYRNSPKLRALVEGIGSFVPGVTAANTYIVERLSDLERQRREALFQYLDEAGAELTDELINSDDFLHCFTITMRAAQRTRRKEKIRVFARLLASATRNGEARITDVDEYEELLGILVILSHREIQVLILLDKWQARGEGVAQNVSAFENEVMAQTAIPREEIMPVVQSLNRTGLCQTIPTLLGNTGSHGHLTARYYRLRDLIADADGDIIGGQAP